MMKTWTFAAAAAIAAAASAPAFAGSLAEPVVEVPPAAPVVVANTGGEWGGFYGGLQLGYADVETEGAAALEGDEAIYGVHAGYKWDLGQWVVGGEIDYDATDLELETAAGVASGETVDSVARLKLKAGYDLGRTLVYATAGGARVDTSVGSDNGGFYGLGMSYQVTDQFLLGGEVLRHEFNDIDGTGIDADANTFTVRASFRF